MKYKSLIKTYCAFLSLGILLICVSLVVCGSTVPRYYMSMHSQKEYSSIQHSIFFINKVYCFIVDYFVNLIHNPLFDSRARPFMIEIADLKLGLLSVFVYPLPYILIIYLIVRLYYIKLSKKQLTKKNPE